MTQLRSTRRTLRAGVLLALTLLTTGLTAACGGDSDDAGPGADAVTVFAAASLTAAFQEIAAEHPELRVTFQFDGSPTLVEQLTAKPDAADVLATADRRTMATAVDAGLVDAQPAVFATNVGVLIVPRGNPGRVTGLDSSLDGAKLVICAETVPCGVTARAIAEAAGVRLRPVSEEQKVTDVRGKVESGEADAGIVFATDARSAGRSVETIALPGADRAATAYPIALVADAPHQEAGRAFVAAVTGPRGRAVLERHGFRLP